MAAASRPETKCNIRTSPCTLRLRKSRACVSNWVGHATVAREGDRRDDPTEARSDLDEGTQRVGPMVAYTLYDAPGHRVNEPTIIGILHWHLVHPYRTGEDVS